MQQIHRTAAAPPLRLSAALAHGRPPAHRGAPSAGRRGAVGVHLPAGAPVSGGGAGGVVGAAAGLLLTNAELTVALFSAAAVVAARIWLLQRILRGMGPAHLPRVPRGCGGAGKGAPHSQPPAPVSSGGGSQRALRRRGAYAGGGRGAKRPYQKRSAEQALTLGESTQWSLSAAALTPLERDFYSTQH